MDAAASTIVPRRITRPDTWLRNGGLLGIWLLLLIFIVYPLLMLLSRAFLEDGHLNLQALLAAITAPKNMRALGNSLLLATLVGVAGTLLGLIFAFTVERVRGARRISRLIDFFTFLPLISPPFTTSIAFVFSFGPRGLITYELLGIKNVQVYGLTSTFAAETLTYFRSPIWRCDRCWRRSAPAWRRRRSVSAARDGMHSGP
jgi:iron(III) transport system permease protein